MKIHPDCKPCLIRQMENTAKVAGAGEDKLLEVGVGTLEELERIWDNNASPPAISAPLYHLTGRICGEDDPYRSLKTRYTMEALDLLPAIEERVSRADDPFHAAVRVAIAGNVIDFGTGLHEKGIALEETLEEFFTKPLFSDSIVHLAERASKASSILYIGDNAGETVFDRPLLSRLGGARVYYAAKGGAVINDATVHDAATAGVQSHAEIVSTGSRTPGTVLEDCSEGFNRLFAEADLVVAKGQANFETLTELTPDKRIFMLFTVKCPVAANHLGASMRDMVVMRW